MRVLFTSTQGLGHFQPLLPFMDACRDDGHEVLIVVPPALRDVVQATGHASRIADDPPADELQAVWGRVASASLEEANDLVVGEIFGRLKTDAMLPRVRETCADWRPDLILRDSGEYAAAVAADGSGIPVARVGVSLAAAEATMLATAGPVLERHRAGLGARIAASPYLTLFPGSIDPSPFAATHRFRDPAGGRDPGPLPDWWGGDDAPLAYVTFGSVLGSMDIAPAAFAAAVGAVRGLDARVLLTTGRDADPSALPELPPNVHAERFVPQAQVLAEAAVVVCHGGSGTTVGTLAAGRPLVIVPLFADQPDNARQVEAAGAGIAVPAVGPAAASGMRVLTEDDVPRIRAAIEAVLADPAHRRAAERIAGEVRALPGVATAVGVIAATRA